MTHINLSAIDTIGRASTIYPYVDNGTLTALYHLDKDPGCGSLTGTNPLTQFTVTGGSSDDLRATAKLVRDHQSRTAQIEPWHSKALAWADAVEALAAQHDLVVA